MKNWSMGWRKKPVVHCQKPAEERLWGWEALWRGSQKRKRMSGLKQQAIAHSTAVARSAATRCDGLRTQLHGCHLGVGFHLRPREVSATEMALGFACASIARDYN